MSLAGHVHAGHETRVRRHATGCPGIGRTLVGENDLDETQRELTGQQMLQALLADYFKLALHQESKDLPIYELVAAGEETRIVLEKSKAPDYRQKLADELKEMGSSEMWRAGEAVRRAGRAERRESE